LAHNPAGMSKARQPTWGGRFAAGPAAAVKQFTESVSVDRRLYRQDIAGSVAHARGLARAGLLSRAEAARIERGLRAIEREIASGRFQWDAGYEDVHMNIEAALVRKIGAAGAKLHAARSRNDQVATDLRLWLRAEIGALTAKIRRLQKSLVRLAANNAEVAMPGYTHLQRAQPVSVAHHLLAYVEMFERDVQRFADCRKRANVCPLGAGALAGSTLRVDRDYVAKLLGFDGVAQNSMDAVSDRDFALEFLAAAAIAGVHVSRLAEDLVLWSSVEFGFVAIGEAYTTGSSLMPQKKNPDVAELARGKTGRLTGNLQAALVMLKGLPLAYNRDMQEDKPALFDSADTLGATLSVMAEMLGHTRVNRARCEAAASDPALLATDLADFLVKRGVPFREAHQRVGELVASAERQGKSLAEAAREAFGAAAGRVFELRRALAARTAVGAPSPARVRAQIARWKKRLG
jgi:argininosuccinate lyase